jgi:hypothetical protein
VNAVSSAYRDLLSPQVAVIEGESLSLNDTYPIRRVTPIQSGPVSHSEDGQVS